MPDDPQDDDLVQDLGEPTSYLVVGRGVPVFTSDGARLGRLVEVLKEDRADMFDGIVVDTTAGPGGHKFVDAPEVGEIFDRGIVLTIDAEQAKGLSKPKVNTLPRGLRGRLGGR
jgi:hypothetical protein